MCDSAFKGRLTCVHDAVLVYILHPPLYISAKDPGSSESNEKIRASPPKHPYPDDVW